MSVSIVAVAPGKVILFGEHAVCFGKKAIATAIGLHTRVEIKEQPESGQVTVQLKDLDCKIDFKIQELASIDVDELSSQQEKLFRLQTPSSGNLSQNARDSIVSIMYLYLAMAAELGKRLHEINIVVSSTIPIGAGLGSSAAFGVAISGALLKLFNGSNQDPKLDFINKWAFKSELIFHGKPSGIDNSIATFGGTLSFHDGSHQVLPKITLSKLIIVQTKIQRNTKALVSRTIERKNKFPDIVGKVIDAIGDISEEAVSILQNSDLESLKELAEINQNLLCSLGAGHSSIDEIITISKKYGLNGKLTGAGGGGCVIIFPKDLDSSHNEIITELNQRGYQADMVTINCPGISFH